MDSAAAARARHVDPLSNQMILRAFALVTLSFVGSAFVPQWLDRSISTSVKTIVADAAPSVTHLAVARSELHRLSDFVSDYVTPRHSAAMLAQVEQARAVMTREIELYLALPFTPGEREAWEAVSEAMRVVNRTVDETIRAVDEGDMARAKRLVLTDLRSSVDRASAAFMVDVQFNADVAGRAANRIGRQRRTSLLAALALGGLGVASATIAAVRVARVNSRHRVLEEEHARWLEERNRELDEFATRVAHDVASPLASTKLALDLVTRRGGDEVTIKQLSTARAGVDRAVLISSALLEFARAGARPARNARADVAKACTEVMDELGPEVTQARIATTCVAPPGLEVACSQGLLVVVISNLVRNAIKYIGDVEERRVQILAEAVPQGVRIEVIDTGPGLPDELKKHVFEPYVRGTSREKGLGLGLATVKRVVDSHGGTVGVESHPGEGARFWFVLPRPTV